INNDYFTVEASPDPSPLTTPGQAGEENWHTVGVVKGAGNSSSVISYQLLDDDLPITDNLQPTTLYYRLKTTDFDGKYTYSSIIAVNFNRDNTFSVFPNPSDGENVFLEFSEILEKEVLVVINDITGKEYFTI